MDVPLLVNGEFDGLGYQCGEKGLFAYYRFNYHDDTALKLFYDTSHLLQIVSQSYSRGAFYYDYGGLSIDEKRYEEISREYLSTEDSRRYSQKLSYLQKQAEHYYSSHDSLKRKVLEEIAFTHDKRMIPTVKKYLKTSSGSEPDTELLHTALFTLGEIGDKSLLPLLRSYLSHDESMIRVGTLFAMGKIVDSRDEALLIDIHPLLDDDELMVQANAIELIGKIASETSLPLLLERFENQKPRLQLMTIEALGRIGNSEALPLLKSHLKKVRAMDASKDESSIFKGYVPPVELVKYTLERAIAYIEGEMK
jgi:HEAT repeat protein